MVTSHRVVELIRPEPGNRQTGPVKQIPYAIPLSQWSLVLASQGEQRPVLGEFRQTALARQASFGYGHRQADSELRPKMSDADKIVAATFAVARCGGLGHGKPEDYIAEYDIFLRLLNEREATAEHAERRMLGWPSSNPSPDRDRRPSDSHHRRAVRKSLRRSRPV